ncbi:MAG: esterase-like activity of phytase family protein [Defluviicoccus sp.]
MATFNASLSRPAEGLLIDELAAGDSAQAQAVAEIIQRVRPDVLLINEFDHDASGTAAALLQAKYLGRGQHGAQPIHYPYVFYADVNTGVASGFDLDRSGSAVQRPGAPGYANDAWGFGAFPGQFGMLLLSTYPVITDQVRTFRQFLWKDMPDALLPDDPATPAAADWYQPEALARLPLSSKSHWDVPLRIEGETVHILAAHPTPPVFDGAEDRNGRRNHDEIRLLADYVAPGRDGYIIDDDGRPGGLGPGERFIIVGDLNADPIDGDSTGRAMQQLLHHPLINAGSTPVSQGAAEAAFVQGGVNAKHKGDPASDSADFQDRTVGNLRLDYVLPSVAGLTIAGAGVFWPEQADPCFRLIGGTDAARPGGDFVSSDHRLVWADVALTQHSLAPTKAGIAVFSFLGEVQFPSGFAYAGTVVGGLSGIAYDATTGAYYAVSDDRSQVNSARLYTLTIDVADGRLDDGDVVFTGVTTLRRSDGEPFPAGGVDPEGIALTEAGTLYIASEGNTAAGIPPFINAFSIDGRKQAALPIPEKFLPDAGGTQGVRNNLAFESLTLTPDGRFLFTATENALVQDGPVATLEQGSPTRILKFDTASGRPVAEYLYRTQPIAAAPLAPLGLSGNGLVELLALDSAGTLLALERSYSVGAGITARLFEVDTRTATDISAIGTLEGTDGVEAVTKRLVFDLGALGIPLDNLEGLTFGPDLPDGRRSLIIVSDDNFNPGQFTQVLAFAIETAADEPAEPGLGDGENPVRATLPEATGAPEELGLRGCESAALDSVTVEGLLAAAAGPPAAGEAAPAAGGEADFLL